jgi:hypothetical protein
VSTRDVDNTQPSHSDANRPVRIETFVVRATMRDNATHFAQSSGTRPFVPTEFKYSSDPAHSALLREG